MKHLRICALSSIEILSWKIWMQKLSKRVKGGKIDRHRKKARTSKELKRVKVLAVQNTKLKL